MDKKQENLANMRNSYEKGTLSKDQIDENPFQQFQVWFDLAVQSDEIYEANAMVVATASKNAQPSARITLLRGIQEDGFVFYTNYNSRKGQEMLENPQVSLLFFWDALERQIRIEGHCEKVPEEQSTNYFQSRPKESQICSMLSNQSSEIESRSVLENEKKVLEDEYAEVEKIPRPENWGGFIIKPTYFEFWQGRAFRLHDRIAYKSVDGKWQISRLAP